MSENLNENLINAEEVKKQEKGASLVEYALLAALIAVVCIVAITFLGQSASTQFSAIGSAIAPVN